MKTVDYDAIEDFQNSLALPTPNIESGRQIDGKPVITIKWQDGAGTDKNGAFIEEVLIMAYSQLKGFNDKLPSRENSLALTSIEQAVLWLAQRKANRVFRGVHGEEKK